MSSEHTSTETTGTGTAAQPSANGTSKKPQRRRPPVVVAPTEAELRQRPCPPRYKAFRVQVGDQVRYAFAGWANHAVLHVFKALGGTVGRMDQAVTKGAVAAKLAEFTDEELAELGLARRKGKK